MLIFNKQPKCGFLPVSRFVSEETAIKKRVTRFEMHQALKLNQGEVLTTKSNLMVVQFLHSAYFFLLPYHVALESHPSVLFIDLITFSLQYTLSRLSLEFEIYTFPLSLQISLPSEYNPLDLFSGSKERIHKAIKDLFTTPQNNFRVFMNGSLIFGGLGGGAEDTNLCIAKAFEGALKSIVQADDGLCTENFLTLVAEAAHKSGVLDRLLEVQKLDDVDIEGAIHAYYDITHQQCMVCTELNEDQMKTYTPLHSASLDESLRIVKDYLIAATSKDCSLMICFRPSKEVNLGSVWNNVYLESSKQTFDFKVGSALHF